MTTTTTTVTSRDGTAIAFDRLGDGPPLVLVGGAFQHRAIDPSTAALAEKLASRFTVIHYDRRGRGESGDTARYAPEREIEDLEALIAEAGGSAAVFAMSSGGALALDAARTLPIGRLALYEPPFIVDDSRPPAPADYLARVTALVAAGRRDDAVELAMGRVVGLPDEMIAGMRQAPVWPAFTAVAHTLPYDAAFMDGTQLGRPLDAHRWAAVSVPTLVLAGGDSAPYQHSAVRALADLLPGGHTRTLPGQTHDVDADALAAVLIDFLAGWQAPAREGRHP